MVRGGEQHFSREGRLFQEQVQTLGELGMGEKRKEPLLY